MCTSARLDSLSVPAVLAVVLRRTISSAQVVLPVPSGHKVAVSHKLMIHWQSPTNGRVSPKHTAMTVQLYRSAASVSSSDTSLPVPQPECGKHRWQAAAIILTSPERHAGPPSSGHTHFSSSEYMHAVVRRRHGVLQARRRQPVRGDSVGRAVAGVVTVTVTARARCLTEMVR